MNVARLDQMTGGWFAGNFEPTLLRAEVLEAACTFTVLEDASPW